MYDSLNSPLNNLWQFIPLINELNIMFDMLSFDMLYFYESLGFAF